MSAGLLLFAFGPLPAVSSGSIPSRVSGYRFAFPSGFSPREIVPTSLTIPETRNEHRHVSAGPMDFSHGFPLPRKSIPNALLDPFIPKIPSSLSQR